MPMRYGHTAVPEVLVPRAVAEVFQHAVETYASETNKVASVWREFAEADLEYRPHERASTVLEIFKHQLLSERRFFGEFLGTPEPAAAAVLPAELTAAACLARFVELAQPRLAFLADQPTTWWLVRVPFFDVERQRVWVFWRRVLHTAHHRTQLTTYLRVMGRAVPATYGPTADVTWTGADPTHTAEAAERR